jgi:hypothetical protein
MRHAFNGATPMPNRMVACDGRSVVCRFAALARSLPPECDIGF